MIVKSNKNWLVSEKTFALKACNWHDTINCVLTAAFKCVLMAKDQYVLTKHLTGLNAAKNIIIFCAKKLLHNFPKNNHLPAHSLGTPKKWVQKVAFQKMCRNTQSWRSTSWVPLQKKVQNKRSFEQWKTVNETFESYQFCDAPHSLFRVCGYEVTLTWEHLMFMK